MSTVDNRPFYFSQIRVDPKNPNRIYRLAVDMQFSDDGGHSWRLAVLGQHEDYHGMWIDPNDPQHYIIGGDAGIFQTWDRGGNYDAVNNMAMGQFYGVSYDFQVPYRVCGGLQDNGSSCGWSRRRDGELHMDDWFALFAADGLRTAQDPNDPNIIYYESQGGNMSRKDLATGVTVSIKPRTVTVNTFGAQIQRIKGDGTTPLTGAQQQEIAGIRATMKREMSDPNVATRWNWNTPCLLSVHDANVIYSGADKVFKSVQKGSAPFAISPDFSAANLDWIRVSSGFDENGDAAKDASGGITRDATGAEENATIVALAESPIRAGLVFAGTDDGKLEMTRNDGGTWENIGGHFPGAPAVIHVIGIEPSHVDSATIYAALDNHRENDFKPYLYVTHDWGKTWTSIASNLPSSGRPGSVYVVREDPVNPNLLYCGTEVGAWASLNKG
ncbi:MAG: WD40/YVTN/BNR-like repeat-containing protein, partial [Polyangiaceae bacterium]